MMDSKSSVAPVLELKGIRKSFNVGEPNETEILHGIDLVLRPGEFCSLIGPSGSGKSTLLNIVGLLDRPTAGSLSILQKETTRLDDDALTGLRRHSIGFVFQYHHLITAFTAIENVMMPMLGDRGFPDEAMRKRAEVLLDSVCREQGTSVLFVTHNPELSARCDKTIEVIDGQVSAH